MIPLGDARWKQLNGGYRQPYDPTSALRQLRDGVGWEELWENLHHQGDVDLGSYAAVPHLVAAAAALPNRDHNVYSLCATIEVQRHARQNPELPAELKPDYDAAWRQLLSLALADAAASEDAYLIRSALAVIALARGNARLGAFLADLDDSELDELLEERLDWSARYRG